MDDAFLLVILLFGVVILARLVTLALGPTQQERVGRIASSCPPHKWSIHPVTNKHQCTECDYVAGTYKTEHGEY